MKLDKESWHSFLDAHPWVKRWVLNKYIVAGVVCGLLFLFGGEQSLLQQCKRLRHMRHLQEQITISREHIAQCERDLQTLTDTDSLERFAREKYHMHAPNEEEYVIKP